MNNLQTTPLKRPIVFPKKFICVEHRADRNAPISWDQCYFMRFRVNTDAGNIYEHAMMIADCHNNLMLAIDEFSKSLVDFVMVKSKHEVRVDCIFNLMMQDTRLIPEAKILEAVIEQLSHANRMHDESYFAVGLVESQGLKVTLTVSTDALIALDAAKIDVLEYYGQQFRPILVCQAPMTGELKSLLRVSIQLFTQLLSSTPITTDYLH